MPEVSDGSVLSGEVVPEIAEFHTAGLGIV